MYLTIGIGTFGLNRMISSVRDDQDEACENGEAGYAPVCERIGEWRGGVQKKSEWGVAAMLRLRIDCGAQVVADCAFNEVRYSAGQTADALIVLNSHISH